MGTAVGTGDSGLGLASAWELDVLGAGATGVTSPAGLPIVICNGAV